MGPRLQIKACNFSSGNVHTVKGHAQPSSKLNRNWAVKDTVMLGNKVNFALGTPDVLFIFRPLSVLVATGTWRNFVSTEY